MERILNTENGWEEIVNDAGRRMRIDTFHAKRYQRKVDLLSAKAFLYGLGAAAISLLGITGALTGWIAFPVAFVLAGVSCFDFGRVYQLKR